MRYNVFTIKIIIKTPIRKMSDDESPSATTTVDITPPEKGKAKRPRTEAQKKATAKALEALALHRQAKYEEKQKAMAEEKAPALAKHPTAPVLKDPLPKSVAVAQKPTVKKVSLPAEPKADPRVGTRSETVPEAPDYRAEFERMRAEMEALKSKTKKVKKVVKKHIRPRVIEEPSSSESESESSSDDEPPARPAVRRKKQLGRMRPTPSEEPVENKYTHLESIFFRNH